MAENTKIEWAGMKRSPSPVEPTSGGSSAMPPDRSTSAGHLRDHFAGLAMHAEALSAGSHEGAALALAEAASAHGQTIEERIAHNAYQLADAMMKARRHD